MPARRAAATAALAFVCALLLAAGPAAAQTALRFTSYGPPQDTSPGLGSSGGDVGVGSAAAEPSVGVNHATGAIMYIAALETLRLEPDHCASPPRVTWRNKSFATTSLRTLDPILFTDHDTGRTFSSQLAGKCSAMAFSDDDGETWTPSQGCGMNAGADHQTVGGGPFPASDPLQGTGYDNAVYYCSQDVALAQCALSRDGGLTFGPAVPIYTQADCSEIGGKLHGHVKVAPDGTVYVPQPGCNGNQIVAVSTDAGTTWAVRPVPFSTNGAGSDPAVYADAANRVYFGYVDGDGHVKVTTSDDRGLAWTPPVDVGAPVGVVTAAFPQVIAGDAGRAAVAFLGSANPDLSSAYGTDVTAPHTWYLYVAMTWDAGANWETVLVTPGDPVQRGTICMQGTLCAGGRNLLDFNEIDVTEDGRVVVAYADGCVGACIPGPPNSGTDVARIALQTGGRRLYAAFDAGPGDPPAAPAVEAVFTDPWVSLTWSEPESGAAITGYEIDRRRVGAGEGTFTTLAPPQPIDAQTFSYLDQPGGPDPHLTEYRVRALYAGGEGLHCGDVVPGEPLGSTVSCTPPGVAVAVDSFDAAPILVPELDARRVSIAEPFQGGGDDRVRFTVELADLTSPLPAGNWFVLWYRPTPDGGADRHYVAVRSAGTGSVTFERGTVSPPNGNVATPVDDPLVPGPDVSGSVDYAANTFVIEADPSLFDDLGPGDDLPGVELRVFAGAAPATVAQSAATDFTGAGTYTLVGNDACGPNGLPIAADDGAFTDPGVAKEIDVLANDSDPDGDPLTVAVVFQPPGGVTARTPEGRVLYTPDPGFTGADSFDYRLSDGRGGETIGTVTVTVADLPNFPPLAADDDATVPAGMNVAVDVLANDTDQDGDTLSIAAVTLPGACGTPLLDAANQRVSFFADAAFLGGCCFDYTVTDGRGGSDTGEACVRVTCPPEATGEVFSDFDGADDGFTVDTFQTTTGSLDWARRSDPTDPPSGLAWHTNDPAVTALESKDDRLVSPPVDLSPSSTLEFAHRFLTEDTFDGGVLEVSLDGGASWQTVPPAAFLQGAYNSSATGSPAAWSGQSASYPLHDAVAVDLSAYAGLGRRLRWRFVADSNAGFDGWWVDEVRFTDTLVPGTCEPLPACIPGGAYCFHTLAPCRVYDSRQDAQLGKLLSGVERAVAVAAAAGCGVPPAARGVAVNLTVLQSTAGGHLTVYDEPGFAPLASTLNFGAGQVRANNGVFRLGDLGEVVVLPYLVDGGDVHLVVDVFGWFE
jgi:hypothetical protein